MAWLEQRGGRYRLKFRYGGREHGVSIKTDDRRKAEARRGKLEDALIDLEQGKLVPPPGADLGLFLLSGGRLDQKPVVEESHALGEVFDGYRASTNGKEANTRYTERIHMDHLERLL